MLFKEKIYAAALKRKRKDSIFFYNILMALIKQNIYIKFC